MRFHYIDYRTAIRSILDIGHMDTHRSIANKEMISVIKKFILNDPRIKKQINGIKKLSYKKAIRDYIDHRFSVFGFTIPLKEGDIILMVMDIYTIARMLKPKFKNCIIYTGSNHSHQYYNFMTEYIEAKHVAVEINVDNTIECLDMTSVKDVSFLFN